MNKFPRRDAAEIKQLRAYLLNAPGKLETLHHDHREQIDQWIESGMDPDNHHDVEQAAQAVDDYRGKLRAQVKSVARIARDNVDVAPFNRLAVYLRQPGRANTDKLRELCDAVLFVLEDLDQDVQRPEPCRHSCDFASVVFFGTEYTFTPQQSHAVKLLWKNWEVGTPTVRDQTILEAIDHQSPPRNLTTVFRDSPAWDTMIVDGDRKGTHRLANAKEFQEKLAAKANV